MTCMSITWKGMLWLIPGIFIGISIVRGKIPNAFINSQRKDTQGIPPSKKKNGSGIAQLDFEKSRRI